MIGPMLLKVGWRVVTKLDRLARSLPDARAISDELTVRLVRLNLRGSVYDPTDRSGGCLFNVLAMVAEFESDLIWLHQGGDEVRGCLAWSRTAAASHRDESLHRGSSSRGGRS